MSGYKGFRGSALGSLVFLLFCILVQVLAQDCSASNPCATGCCSKHGYCGTGEDYCGADCVANCDYESKAQCSATKPCAEGCCSKFGICGYGPDYCSKDNCVSSCGQLSECDPGDWGSEFANSTTCPLNVCCSKYGFCGTTEEFCGEKKVKRPSCGTSGKTGKLQRVVGYYEGWAFKRVCQAFWPEQIPSGVYTHLNYAFATIDPDTFEVLPPTALEAGMMKRLTSLKQDDAGLRVNIAIGGWSFNDPGATASIFTELAASEANQRKFFKSLTSFLATYDFDGVDIDWEYPVDSDRGGLEADFKNFPRFMSNLKSALKGTGGRDELSLTLPTSYWYLRHFDIKSLAKSVDYFNYMSYDLHGTWDRGNKWTGDFLDAHTNLTELTESLDLLWRNDISPDKVVMGIAFYSRAFTVADTNCMTPGCRFASGSDAGPCSAQTGILLNSELDDIRANKSLAPTLDKEAAVQIVTWDNQWATYDDETTFKLRTEFAKKTCLGGVMVWAVSHDTYDGSYSRALAGISPRSNQFKALTVSSDGLTVTEDERVRQCKWTNCGQTCPDDYVAVSRSDPGYRKGELMMDSIDCPKGSAHTLCCPKEETPKCGWYTHNNGNCKSDCPSGYFEIGSISQGLCHESYEAACCESNMPSTKLYNTVQWSTYPKCDDGECPVVDDKKSDILALATTGSGDAQCYFRTLETYYGYGPVSATLQERKLCYDSSQDKMAWEDCDWYDSVDSPPKGKPKDYCVNSCPADTVRLATYKLDENCNGGTRAFCCNDQYYVSKSRTNPEIADFRTALNNYLVDGSCSLGTGASLGRRDMTKEDYLTYLTPLTWKLIKMQADALNAEEKVLAAAWDTWAKANKWAGLVLSTLRPYAQQSRLAKDMSGEYLAQSILCRPQDWSDLAQKKPLSACFGDPCDEDADPELCQAADMDAQFVEDDEEEEEAGIVDKRSRSGLVKRSDPKKFKVWCRATMQWFDGLSISAPGYPQAGAWTPTDTPFQEARTYQDPNDCANPLLDPIQKTGDHHDTEHVLELQVIPKFFQDFTFGRLVSGQQPTFNPADCNLFLPTALGGMDILHQQLLDQVELYHGDYYRPLLARRPQFRIMSALGTSKNKANFYLLERKVNGMKMRVFRNVALVESGKWKNFVDDTTQPGVALQELKAAIAVWDYLNDAQVKQSFFADAWDEWWYDYIDYQVDRSFTWITKGIADMRRVWNNEPVTNPLKLQVLSDVNQLEGWADAIVIYGRHVFTT
ncbi:class V chitinase [Aspergillus uvarum CBS 121591]|uniref:chitinase n=1 Tax=Aspergillus uvarum CBS 121591 TaxID=1448315 RepID=A0A319C586_9EURO|nr:class V chitinase [Aspergillus uvarum CBS 121591]PYH80405.1 class V chitinase [Aspergillus uvarum CBS 121591]